MVFPPALFFAGLFFAGLFFAVVAINLYYSPNG
jgi:hypothetical protein